MVGLARGFNSELMTNLQSDAKKRVFSVIFLKKSLILAFDVQILTVVESTLSLATGNRKLYSHQSEFAYSRSRLDSPNLSKTLLNF